MRAGPLSGRLVASRAGGLDVRSCTYCSGTPVKDVHRRFFERPDLDKDAAMRLTSSKARRFYGIE